MNFEDLNREICSSVQMEEPELDPEDIEEIEDENIKVQKILMRISEAEKVVEKLKSQLNEAETNLSNLQIELSDNTPTVKIKVLELVPEPDSTDNLDGMIEKDPFPSVQRDENDWRDL